MIPLTMACAGEKNIIRKITAPETDRLRLAELGFVLGSEITVISTNAGNVILSVKNSRIALDKGMAQKIMI